MPIMALDLSATRVEESKYDDARGTDRATKFTLGTIDSKAAGYIRDRATKLMISPNQEVGSDVPTTMEQNSVYYQAFAVGVLAWENFRDREGNDIKRKTQRKNIAGKDYEVITDAVMRRVPLEVINEFGQMLLDENELKEQEGNASGSSSSDRPLSPVEAA